MQLNQCVSLCVTPPQLCREEAVHAGAVLPARGCRRKVFVDEAPILMRLICIEEGIIVLQIHANDRRKHVEMRRASQDSKKGVNK